MGKSRANKETTAAETSNAENSENSSPTKGQHGEANANPAPSCAAASLAKVLEEIRDFRKDTKEQLNDIKSEIISVNQKIAEAEVRIEKVEDRVQNLEQVLNKVIKVMHQQENKLLDHEGRSRRENLRIYNVPEGAEGSSMMDFVEKLLRDTLEINPTAELDIERAHRALAPRPAGDRQDKPRSIIVKFLRYKVKEEILRRAWEKKKVFLNGRLIYFDQDYPPAVLQKRKEYAEAKRVLKQKNIRFHTPFPAKLRVFYEDGTRLYQTAEEATTDMKDRGLPVSVIIPKESLAEQLSRTAWETAGGPNRRGTDEEREKNIRERLRAFRR
ncbi:unnamed protein product [Oreochromis niloticus]|nr:unnamed protein product [Mustela putorius furo]